MVEPRTIIPLSSSFYPSDDHAVDTIVNFSSLKKPPSSIVHHLYLATPLTKEKPGRPVGPKNKPKLSHVISQANMEVLKPIYMEVPDNFDVIKVMVQFAHRHKVSITVLSASGTISSVTLNHTDSHASAFTLYGPCSLISLSGTYINNTAFSSSSSSFKFDP